MDKFNLLDRFPLMGILRNIGTLEAIIKTLIGSHRKCQEEEQYFYLA